MKVLIAARKSSSTETTLAPTMEAPPLPSPLPQPTTSEEPVRLPFDEVLAQATVLFLAIPRVPTTLNLISTAELRQMHPHVVLINIARGGIVDEEAVVQALKEKHIAGYATDVFNVEPVGGPEDSPLLADDAKELNITMSPHLAWFAQRTWQNLGDILKTTLEGWAREQAINVIV